MFSRKRARENPCEVCGHYHDLEAGQVCGICGHRLPNSQLLNTSISAFPSEILPGFLYLGTYDNASRSQLLVSQGITHILNTVVTCQTLFDDIFIYHHLQDVDQHTINFVDALPFLEQCVKDRARVLVHCMSGKNRSPAVVVAYLMKSKGWRLDQSYQWVKERRPCVDITPAVYQQLQEYEQKILGNEKNHPTSLRSLSSSDHAIQFGSFTSDYVINDHVGQNFK